MSPDTNIKTQFVFWHREKFIRNTNKKKKKLMIYNKPLCHPMTSHKITQGGWEEKWNSTIQNLWCMLKVKTDVKWNTKLLEPDTKGCVLHNLSLWTQACPKGVNWLQVLGVRWRQQLLPDYLAFSWPVCWIMFGCY